MEQKTAFEKASDIIIYTIIVLFSFMCLYPFIYAIAVSFNDGLDTLKGGIYFIPRVFTLDNYTLIFQEDYILGSYLISIARVLSSIILIVLVNALLAYSLSKKTIKCRKFLNYLVIIPMYINGGFLPTYLVLKSYGLINNVWVYVLPHVVVSFYLILLKAFFSELPVEMEESAFLDGAGHITLFAKIIFPLSMPVIAVVILLAGVYHWNDWFDGVTYMRDIKLYPCASLLFKMLQDNSISNEIMLAISRIRGDSSVRPEALKMTMLVVVTVPILFIYPFLQKYFMKGMMIGAIKG